MKNLLKEKNSQSSQEDAPGMPIPRKGILLLAIGFGVMVLGFILMIGGGSDAPDHFSYAMFDCRRTVLSPLVILAGVVTVIVGIMRKPKQ